MKNGPNETNHLCDAALDELQKLSLLLESDPDVIYAMSEEDVRTELQELGLDSDKAGPKLHHTQSPPTKPALKPAPCRPAPFPRHLKQRHCLHYDQDAEGEVYNGVFYIQALQRLRVDAAVSMAAKVEPFFWSDAPDIVVWLCGDCASELRLLEKPVNVEAIRDRRA